MTKPPQVELPQVELFDTSLRDGLQQPDLEGIFAQLVQQDDMQSRARDIAQVLAQ